MMEIWVPGSWPGPQGTMTVVPSGRATGNEPPSGTPWGTVTVYCCSAVAVATGGGGGGAAAGRRGGRGGRGHLLQYYSY